MIGDPYWHADYDSAHTVHERVRTVSAQMNIWSDGKTRRQHIGHVMVLSQVMHASLVGRCSRFDVVCRIA